MVEFHDAHEVLAAHKDGVITRDEARELLGFEDGEDG